MGKTPICRCLLTSIAGLVFAVGSFYGQTAQEIAKKAFKSTVLLVMEDKNGQPLSLGSGFFVREGEIATNLHVLSGAVSGYAKLVGQEPKYKIEGVTSVDPNRDLVLLKTTGASGKVLPLDDSEAVEVGQPVYAVGNPLGLEGTFSQGIISGIRQIGSDKLLQITAPISPGSSGGPVLSANGEVVGVSLATFREGQNLNFAIPSHYVRKLLEKSGPPEPLAKTDLAEAHKSILADLGDNSLQGVIGTQFVWQSFVDYELIFPYNGKFTLSLRNQLSRPVRDVYMLIIFYDSEDNPLDVSIVTYPNIIPPGLAERVSGSTHGSVQKLTTPRRSPTPLTRIEFRVLDFKILE